MNRFVLSVATACVVASANWAVADKVPVEAGKTGAAPEVLDIRMRDAIVNYAVKNLGKVIGRGDSTDLVDAALEAGDAKPKVVVSGGTADETYQWGKQKKSYQGPEGFIGKMAAVPLDPRYPDVKGRRQYLLRPGDVIQFTSAVFKTAEYSWSLGAPRHTAIVKSATASGSVVLLHQNAPKGSGVKELALDFKSLVKGGSYVAYAPESKSGASGKTGTTPAQPSAYIVCSPIGWTVVNYEAGRVSTGLSNEQLVDLLKKTGFEMKTERRVDLDGSGNPKTHSVQFARLTRETKTPFYDTGSKYDGSALALWSRAIACMLYGGRDADGKQVKRVIP